MMITSKLPNTGITLFSVMSKMAMDFKAIDLTHGLPDYNCSEELITLVSKYMRDGFNSYAQMQGILPLREILSDRIQQLYALKYDPEEEITITGGSHQTIASAITSFVKENDEVIIFEPAYEGYTNLTRLNNGMPVYVSLKAPDYKIDWTEMTKFITSRTRLIIINNPNNPTGSILGEEDLEKLSRLVTGTKITILGDETFDNIVFNDLKHHSLAKFPELAHRSLIISSFGKTYHTNGWNIGYCVAPASLMKEFRKVHQFHIFSVNTPVQYAFAEFLRNNTDHLTVKDFYQKKRDYFLKMLEGSKFKFRPTTGTYYQLLDYSDISDDKDQAFATRLIADFRIAGIPYSAFIHDKTDQKILRFCFAKTEETLQKAAEKLKSVK